MNNKLSVAVLAALTASLHAGPPAPPNPKPAPPENPLSFLDGRVVFDLQDRFRWEYRENNFDFNDSVRSLTDDNWGLNRLRIGLMLKPVEWLKIYAQTQDAREWLSDRVDIPGNLGADGDDSFDLRQGYIEISDYDKCPWGIRIGRQVLAFGDQRLIGPLDWTNLARTFDAVRITYKKSDWSVDAFASSVVEADRGSYNQSDFVNGREKHREQVFSGVYFSTTALRLQTTDLYALHLHENLTGGDTNFITLGTRMRSKPGIFGPSADPAPDGKSVADGKSMQPPPQRKPVGFDYDFEAAFQTGEVRGLDLTAFAVHAGVGYTFDAMWMPRVGIEYNYATGDGNALDGDIETFQNLFPTNHIYYGFMDTFAWQNMHDLAVSVKFNPLKTVTVRTDFHVFWLANTADFWYRANGVTPVRPISPSASNYAGSELDFVVTWNATKRLQFEVGYSHFFAGDYLSDTGASDDADFGYAQATLTF